MISTKTEMISPLSSSFVTREIIEGLVTTGYLMYDVNKGEIQMNKSKTLLFIHIFTLSLTMLIPLNLCGSNWKTLHYGAKTGNKEIIADLLNTGADVEAKDENGETALYIALRNGNKDIAAMLINKGAKIDQKFTPFKATPLHFAVLLGNKNKVLSLINDNVNINLKDKYIEVEATNNTKGPESTKNNTKGPESTKNDENVANNYAKTILETRDKKEQTPLHIAALSNQSDMAKILINNNAHIEAKDKRGHTPLHLAANKDNIEIAIFLLNNGANIEAEDNYGKSPLYTAIDSRKQKIIEILIAKGANIEHCDRYERTPLHSAAKAWNKKRVSFLLEKGAKIEALDNDACTPLYYASKSGHYGTITTLIDSGAKIDLRSIIAAATSACSVESTALLIYEGGWISTIVGFLVFSFIGFIFFVKLLSGGFKMKNTDIHNKNKNY